MRPRALTGVEGSVAPGDNDPSNGVEVREGPFADAREQLSGSFVIDVPDLAAALGWAEKCPAAQYGVIEVRPSAIVFRDGQWHGMA